MKSPRNSKVSYWAATSLFFALAAVVVAMAGLLPSKSNASGTEPTKKEVAVKPVSTAERASLSQEDWLRIARSL